MLDVDNWMHFIESIAKSGGPLIFSRKGRYSWERLWLVRYVRVEQHHDLIGNDDREEQPMEPCCVRARSSRRRVQRLRWHPQSPHIEHDHLIELSQGGLTEAKWPFDLN
jgi:hypothetical protein